jgi:hypothetical protein
MVKRGAALLLLWLYAVASFIHHPPAFNIRSNRSPHTHYTTRSHVIHRATMSAVSMSAVSADLDQLPVEILQALTASERGPQGVASVLHQLLRACRIIGTALRDGEYTSSLTGTENVFGDKQLDIDVQADRVLFECLTRSGVVHVAASEENPTEIDCGYRHGGGSAAGGGGDSGSGSSSNSGSSGSSGSGSGSISSSGISSSSSGSGSGGSSSSSSSSSSGGFSVAFDPLDGSSVVDANFAVGTIAGIWPGKGLLGRVGREQSASLMCIYGPRVTMALALNGHVTTSGEGVSVELTMEKGRWVVTNRRFIGE